MARKTKIHPLDAADRAAIPLAESFNVHLRTAPRSVINEPAAKLADAVAVYDRLASLHPHRRPLIYAIMPNGHVPASVPVPADMIVAARTPDFTDEGEELPVLDNAGSVQEPTTPKAETSVQRQRAPRRRTAAQQEAERGELPSPPDFTAPTHARFRTRLAELVEMANAGDVDGLRAASIPTYSTSPRAMARYRDLAIIAHEARAKKASC